MKVFLACALCLCGPALGGAEIPKRRASAPAPLKAGTEAASTHMPFDNGECSSCHERDDAENPGKVLKKDNSLCLECHEDLQAILKGKHPHAAATEACLSCHNPHNSKQAKLLVEATGVLCLDCHADMKARTLEAPVKHDAVLKGAQCVACHNPHGSEIEHLLVDAPTSICLTCHGKDGVVDHRGNKLTNIAKLLEQNPEHHFPIDSDGCSACHDPHGSEYFRLLTKEYPADFYCSYDPKRYALCFDCHEESAFASAETDSLTQFRDGKRNLHYLHVNKQELGRTCRACHEVHASKQEHQIREGVPYGSLGWILKVNFQKTATGGTCTKTCHGTKSYNNTTTDSKQ